VIGAGRGVAEVSAGGGGADAGAADGAAGKEGGVTGAIVGMLWASDKVPGC
jgi:hypothetical protein